MTSDDNNQRGQPTPRRRRPRKFSLLLSPISMPNSSYSPHDDYDVVGGSGRLIILMSCCHRLNLRSVAVLCAALSLVVLPLWLSLSSSHSGKNLKNNLNDGKSKIMEGSVTHKYSKANVVAVEDEDESFDEVSGDEHDDLEEVNKNNNQGSGRPFEYIGDIDPTKPLPWPQKEKDWWSLHATLVERVTTSDSLPMVPYYYYDNSQQTRLQGENPLPQLVFYGDSITEGWNGTSFGNTPGAHRGWTAEEPTQIRQIFNNHFGNTSTYGKRAARPPLILGISGSRTYDFIWRVENGEFPVSRVFDFQRNSITDNNVMSGSNGAENNEGEGGDQSFIIERIYIILMGTNNLGGGMLPEQTILGMDAAGRTILQKIRDASSHDSTDSNTPKRAPAILFSELLPRKDDFRAKKMCPPRCKNVTTLEPYQSFLPAIEKVNRALPGILDGWRKDFPESRVVLLSAQEDDAISNDAVAESNEKNTKNSIVNCGREMFALESDEEFEFHMPDRLHPNAKGYDLWARCIKRGLEVVLNHSIHLN